MQHIFITGIGTEVGKTVIASIITEALEADYWKPIQAGDLDQSDTLKVKELISNHRTSFHPESYALQHAMSPHAAADLENITIDKTKIKRPITENYLIIEGAGGIMVPINQHELILDLIRPEDKVIVVSQNYLGSINHTLTTLSVLKQYGLKKIGIIFNGEENKTTREIILKMSKIPEIAYIKPLPIIDQNAISKEARRIKESLIQFLNA